MGVVDNIPCPLGYPCLGRLCSGAMTAEGCYAPWTLSHGCSINYLIKFGSNTTPFWLKGSIALGALFYSVASLSRPLVMDVAEVKTALLEERCGGCVDVACSACVWRSGLEALLPQGFLS